LTLGRIDFKGVYTRTIAGNIWLLKKTGKLHRGAIFGGNHALYWCGKEEDTMGILSWIIVGLIAGWLAGELMRGSGFGLVGNIIVGIVGALLGGFLAVALFNIPDPLSGINIVTIVIAFLGSVVLLGILGLLRGSRI
jgi:uncharacterized membrane protein YeaQ/YmgE (transglycosylase-associated protein family)